MMVQQTFSQRLESLGYYPLPRPHTDSPGYSGLMVSLLRTPAEHKPEMIELRLHQWDGETPLMKLHAGTNLPLARVVCPGRIVIRSRQGREVTFYTFGGALESESLPGEIVYSFRSAAPVLELVLERETAVDKLASEVEALFARAEARLKLSSHQLLNRLVDAGSEAVYLTVLQSLLPDDSPTPFSPQHHSDFTTMLQHERNWYQQTGRWPLVPRSLDALLQSSASKHDYA